MIEVSQLVKIFPRGEHGPVRAVDGVSFRCEAGTVFGLLGLNGAGKTTTLRMLATILRPTAGAASVCGHDVTRAGSRVRGLIGYLSGETRLYERLTTRETLNYFGHLHGLERAGLARRVESLLERLGLGGVADRRVGRLSTGLAQRLNLARALVHDPPVLILDEPGAGLDVLGARDVGSLILAARDEGRCVLLSTHVMSEASRLCDRLAVIHDGTVVTEGGVAEIVRGHDDLESAFAARVGAVAASSAAPAAR